MLYFLIALIVVGIQYGSYKLVKEESWVYEDLAWLCWTLGFFGTVAGLFVRLNEKKKREEQYKIERMKHQRLINDRIQQKEQRIVYLMNSDVTSQILTCLRSQGTIQCVYIELSKISATSSMGNPCFVFLQHGIADLPKPTHEEWKMQIDEPYLLAEALNRCLGNEFLIEVHADDWDYFSWSGIELKRKELQSW